MNIKSTNSGEIFTWENDGEKPLTPHQVKLLYFLYYRKNQELALTDSNFSPLGISGLKRRFLEAETTPRQLMLIESFFYYIQNEIENFYPSIEDIKNEEKVDFIDGQYFIVDAKEIINYAYYDLSEKKNARPLIALKNDLAEINEIRAWNSEGETPVSIFPFQLIKSEKKNFVVLPIMNFLRFYMAIFYNNKVYEKN